MEINNLTNIIITENVHFYDDIADTINYINTNYMKPIHLDTLARISCACISTLQRKFREATGTSPMRYLKRLRMSLAADMLVNSKKTVVEIAIDVGYNSVSSFNRHFMSTYSMTPSAWRRQNKLKSQRDVSKKALQSLQTRCFLCVVSEANSEQ